MVKRALDRRKFLLGLGGAPFLSPLAEAIWANPYAPLPSRGEPRNPIRIRGSVKGAGKPLSRVGVSDGLAVTTTDASGEFLLHSDTSRDFVFISLPSGYRIPVKRTGVASFFQPIGRTETGESEAVFELEPLDSRDEEHCFFLWADPQTEDRRETALLHRETVPAVQKVLSAYPSWQAFGIGCGDIMYDHLELYPEYERAVRACGIPFFQVVGNHDLDPAPTNRLATATFRSRFGPEYYSFNRGSVHYVVLNDVFWHGTGYIGYLTQAQLDWLERDLALVEPGSPVVVSLHIPAHSTLYRRRGGKKPGLSDNLQNREALYRLLEPFQAHLLSGHIHENEHVFEGRTHEHVHGAVCGAWWSGPICYDGTPNGFGVYEVRGEEIRWRYQSTGFPETRQFTLHRVEDESRKVSLLANVWDWDPLWKVFWYEDGSRRGEMRQVVGFDPQSVELHSGPDRPARRTWVEPQPSQHLFSIDLSPVKGKVHVEVTDRFGRVFQESGTV